MMDERARLIAAFLFTDLVGAWLWFSFRAAREQAGPSGRVSRPTRPRVGLHDDPQRVLAEAGLGERAQRRGSAPPLR
jgi:hypothetical protein